MTTRIDDRWLWLGFGLFFLAAAKGIQYAVNDIVTLTELDSTTPKTNDNERPEDTISLETLRSLSKHPNPSIASAAQSLIVTRFAASPNAADHITSDLQSTDEDLSRRAKQAIVYLQEWDAELNGAEDLLEEYDFARDEAERLLEGEVSVTRLEDLAGVGRRGMDGEVEGLERFVEARFAGWERIPAQRGVVFGEGEEERRRRRREAVVIGEWDDDEV